MKVSTYVYHSACLLCKSVFKSGHHKTNNYLLNLTATHSNDCFFKARAESDKISKQAQVLWSASQALYRSLKASCPGLSWRQQLRPLQPEITAVAKAAGT